MATRSRFSMTGVIVSSGFGSGDRVVVGDWFDSPIGPTTDIMWASPDGSRTLFAPDERTASFVRGVYSFDRSEVVAFRVRRGRRHLAIDCADRRVEFDAGRGVPIPFPRPAWFTRFVEGPIARRTMRVVTYGVSPTGVREWYRADRWAPLRAAVATVDGVDLGPMAPVAPPVRFGFSEPPNRPSWVAVRPLLEYPAGAGPPPP